MKLRRLFSLILILGLGGCITIFGVGCAAGKSVTNALNITEEADPVDLEDEVENSADELNAYAYENDEAREWVRKAWGLLYKIYPTPAEATSIEARIRVLRDADATGKGDERNDLIITTKEAQKGYHKTFKTYSASLGKHPIKKQQ